jgi:hypothetical protein
VKRLRFLTSMLMIGLLLVAGGPATAVADPGGTVTAWGFNLDGLMDVPAGLTNVVAIATRGNHNLALRADDTVTAWGYNEDGQTDVPEGLTDVVAIAAGYYHSLALREDGTVTAWGSGPATELPPELENVTAIAAGPIHSLALHEDHTVTAWGYNYDGQANVPEDLTDVVAISAGFNHSLALRENGTVTAWGDRESGLTDVPEDLTNVVAIAAGFNHSLALRDDGIVTAWGSGPATELPELENVTAISAGAMHSLALRDNGTVIAWGDNFIGQTDVPAGLTGVVAIAAGVAHNLALVELPAYEFRGFDSPVDNPPAINLAIAGRTIPLKWRLLDSDGNPVTDLANVEVTTTLTPTNSGATVEPIEEYATGKSGLQNLGNGYYQYNWATPKGYAKSTRTLTLDLGPQGGTHELLFTFR